ncbi:LPXTG cell wall anchor domain-containing protein [Radiobacillus sp. PE A8.2]|uniref:LPXTG cell wall anchor domain-containing protein n=1 Tax=Radiobacillus sp. PE A8.2 TaxID=3380349 RepID=UPI00388D15E3
MDWGNISVANTGELPYVEEQGPEIDTAELGALIETAKSISNEFETYTETTYQTLQDAITEAEAAKDTIKYEYQLYSILESLQKAIDDLIEIVDLGPGFHFDFGSETSTLANGYERIAHTTEYTEEIGYGFIGGSDGFRDQEGDDLRRDFILAYQKEFAVDLANGDYDVKIISGSEWNSNTTTYILEGGESRGGKGTSGGEFVEYTDTVTVEDGQLNIEFAGEWARINAVEVVAVEDFNVKYDFGSDTSPVKYDWNQVSSTMVYDSETGYGLDQEVANRDRGVSDDVRRDFVIGGDYQFMVDLRNGTYDLKIIAGDGIASNRSSFVIEGEDVGSISSRSGEFAELEVTVTVTDGQLNVELGENGRINGLEIYAHKAIDVSELEDLIVMAKAYTNDNQTYTEASFTALQDAIATAESALATIDSEEALAEGVVALQVAINGLEESEIDVTALEELITVAKSYTNEDETYTEASFTALQDAITTAENAVDTIDTEEALAEAVAALKSAIDGLEEVDLDITTLEELISTAKAYTNEDEYYTEASFTALQDAIATAESALNTIDSEEALTEAIAALKAAIDALEERDNYDPSVVASLEDLVLNGDGVYEFNYATKTITIKKEVLDQLPEGSSIQLTNGVVKAIIPISLLLKDTDITFTFGEVSKKVIESNPEALSDLYDFSITADEEPISDFNVPITLTFVVDPAKVTNWEDLKVELIGSNGEKQEQITPISYDESSGEVVVKVSHFSIYGVFEIASQNPDEQKVDVTELEELITTAKAYSNVDQTYTSDSFAALQAAIEQAEASLDTINSEKMLEKQLTELEAAISGLKEVDSDSKDDKSDENDELPDTSSSMFTLLFIGVVMLIIGASFFFVLRSKRLKE